MIAAYLTEERELGRIAADADVDALALSLIGAGHLLFAGREGARRSPRRSRSGDRGHRRHRATTTAVSR